MHSGLPLTITTLSVFVLPWKDPSPSAPVRPEVSRQFSYIFFVELTSYLRLECVYLVQPCRLYLVVDLAFHDGSLSTLSGGVCSCVDYIEPEFLEQVIRIPEVIFRLLRKTDYQICGQLTGSGDGAYPSYQFEVLAPVYPVHLSFSASCRFLIGQEGL